MKQMSFASAEYAGKRRQTRRDRFLAELNEVVPWSRLEALIGPRYPKSGKVGRLACRGCCACTSCSSGKRWLPRPEVPAVLRDTASKCQDGKCELSSTHRRKGRSMAIAFVGVDLAKTVFAVHGVGEAGRA